MALPYSVLDYGRLRPAMLRAAVRGFVSADSAQYVHDMFTAGGTLGVDVEQYEQTRRGTKWHRNYKTATEHRSPVSKGIRKRLEAGKSLCLGRMEGRKSLELLPKNSVIYPMGGLAKKMEPDEWRPLSDHTKSELNLYTSLEGLEHNIRSEEIVIRHFTHGRYMSVGDVVNAFALIPLSPRLWKWFLFVWFNPYDESDADEYLYSSIFADFGTRGAPGAFYMLFAQVLVGTAKSEGVVGLPMAIHVDDFSLIGWTKERVDDEMSAFEKFLNGLNVELKDLKARMGAQRQEMIGFVWDSRERTRELLREKREMYVATWGAHRGASSLSLRELQSDVGTLQRSVKTLPPGAGVLMANVLAAARGLKLPWQRRRVSRAMRADYDMISKLIEENMGKGWFDFAHFARAPDLYTDASKQVGKYVGGGYFSMCGRYGYWKYGSRASRKHIDELEADTAYGALRALADEGLLRGKVVRLYIDNQAFQLSADKGWSRADRLNQVLFAIFRLSLRHVFIVEWVWISTEANVYADALSRSRDAGYGEKLFLELVLANGVVSTKLLRRDPQAGALRQLGDRYSSNAMKDGPSARRLPIAYTAAYRAVSIYAALPSGCVHHVDMLLDNRLTASSRRTVDAAVAHWRVVCERNGWELIIVSNDEERGSKLAAFVAYLAYETDLV